MHPDTILEEALRVFAADLAAAPSTSLRSGYEIDGYRSPVAFDPELDAPSETYLERYDWGIGHLDPASWRHYIPHLMSYALRHAGEATRTCDFFLNSLRPPDRDPPRLGSISPEQESVIHAFLEFMAFSETSAHQNLACQTLEEWWIPGALYRPEGP